MELLHSLGIDNAPSLLHIFKYAVGELLKMLRSLLLLYPVNLLIFVAVIFIMLRKITSRFSKKPVFEEKYSPLPHVDSADDEAKVLKR